jgi:hypothetical protein
MKPTGSHLIERTGSQDGKGQQKSDESKSEFHLAAFSTGHDSPFG